MWNYSKSISAWTLLCVCVCVPEAFSSTCQHSDGFGSSSTFTPLSGGTMETHWGEREREKRERKAEWGKKDREGVKSAFYFLHFATAKLFWSVSPQQPSVLPPNTIISPPRPASLLLKLRCMRSHHSSLPASYWLTLTHLQHIPQWHIVMSVCVWLSEVSQQYSNFRWSLHVEPFLLPPPKEKMILPRFLFFRFTSSSVLLQRPPSKFCVCIGVVCPVCLQWREILSLHL